MSRLPRRGSRSGSGTNRRPNLKSQLATSRSASAQTSAVPGPSEVLAAALALKRGEAPLELPPRPAPAAADTPQQCLAHFGRQIGRSFLDPEGQPRRVGLRRVLDIGEEPQQLLLEGQVGEVGANGEAVRHAP